ncbi:MAG TPA: YggS family pyridoxal phosphate-dependent enzyme [Polyangiales bacterium]|nr:YggS family pyridoxal phosphate-dependent enzyme [Polyangiales bacterium]
MSALAERYQHVLARIPRGVRLIAVSKFHPAAAIRELYALGQRDFGENYAQELAEKAAALRGLPELRLHYIGGIQRNKLKLLLDSGALIDTLASEAHARAIHERASAPVPVLLQVNVMGEAQKGGVAPDDLPTLIEAVRALPKLTLRGLMTIPPADDLASSRHAYEKLAQLAREHALEDLSMGMSDDLDVALAAGATEVRIGTAIFGPRPPKD